jgi:hypothetical protein
VRGHGGSAAGRQAIAAPVEQASIDLGARLAADRQGAIGEIYAALGTTVLSYLQRLVGRDDAEDVLQRVFYEVGDTTVATTPPGAWRGGCSASRATERSTTCVVSATLPLRSRPWTTSPVRTAENWLSAMHAPMRFAAPSPACPRSNGGPGAGVLWGLHPITDRHIPGPSAWNR